jgi:hypothetical protein
MASFRPAGGSFQPAVEVAPTWSPGSIDLAVTPSGAGLVGYAAPGPEAYQARPAVAEFDTLTQTFRAPQTFDTDLDGQLRVAASGSNAVAAWDTPDSVEAAQGDLVHGLGDTSTAWCHGGGEGLVDAAVVGSVPGLLVRAAQPSRYPEYNQNELFLLRGAGGGSPTCSQPAAPAPTAASAEPSAASSPSPDSSAVQVADPAPIPPEHAARPTISHVRLTRSALRFRLSRPAVVSVRFKRRGHTVAAFSLSCVAGENAHRLSKRLRRIIRTSRVKVSLSAS